MRTLTTKQPAKDSAQQEQHGERGRSPLAVSGVRSQLRREEERSLPGFSSAIADLVAWVEI